MKKIILALILSLVCFGLCSCFNIGGIGGGGNGEPEEYIYTNASTLYIVYDPTALSEDQINSIFDKFSEVGVLVAPRSKDSAPEEHELVIGDLGREVSDQAYVQLDRIDKNSPSDLRYCIYSSGSSLAIAYDEDHGGFCLGAAIEYFLENYVKDELVLEKGVAYKLSLDVYNYLADKDAEEFSRYWAAVSDALGADGEDVVTALKALYTIYDGEGIATWIANLYDPGICVCKSLYGEKECLKETADAPDYTKFCGTGGFYFSNSARDTIGFLPDVESTLQALNIIGGIGITEGLGEDQDIIPAWMSEQIVNFAYNLQDPDGYFYHPQWGKTIGNSRRGRDSTWSLTILKRYGVSPKYKTAIENLGDVDDMSAVLPGRLGNSHVAAVSKVVAVEGEALIPDYLQTTEAFKAYLVGLDIKHNSYGGGSTLSAQSDQIYARGPEFGKVLIDHLNECQWDNGTWNEELGYDAINGVMKISGSYSKWRAPMPNAEKTVRASFASIDTDEVADGIVDVWNAWVAATRVLENIRYYSEGGEGEYRRIIDSLLPSLADAIYATREKLTVFLKPDGSFVYQASGRTSGVSMGQTVAVAGSDEGDVNATLMGAPNMTGFIFSFMGLSDLTVPMALSKERYVFLETVNNLPKVDKGGQLMEVGDAYDFEDHDVGDNPTGLINSGKKGTLQVVDDPRGEGKAVQLISPNNDSGDCILVKAAGSDKGAVGIVFESDVMINSADNGDATLRLELGDSGETTNSYRISFKFTDGGIEMYDCSSNVVAKRVTNTLASFSYGEWFKLRVEIYNGDHDSFRAKVYLDGKLLAVSDNYYDYHGVKLNGKGIPNTTVDCIRFYVSKNYKVDMLVDNVICYKNTTPYSAEPLHEDYRYLEGALNVDNFSSEGVVYDIEDLEVGGEIPSDYFASAGVQVAEKGENKYLLLEDGASVGFYFTKRAKDVNYSHVALKLLDGLKSGDGVRISFREAASGGEELFGLTFKALTVGSDVHLFLYDHNGNEVGEFDAAADGDTVLGISHFEEHRIIVISVGGSPVLSIKAPESSATFGKATFTAVGNAPLDELVVERAYADYEEMTGPTVGGNIHGFDKTLGEVTVSGNGATVSGGKLNLKANQAATTVYVPVQKVSHLIGYTKFGYDISFSSLPTSGEVQVITLEDSTGNKIISFTLKASEKKVFLCETTAHNVYNTAIEFTASETTSLAFGYYENNGLCKVFVNGECVLTTSLLYDSASRDLSPAKLSVTELKGTAVAQIDNMYAHRCFEIYAEEKPEATPEDESDRITLDSIGHTHLPATLKPSSMTVEDGIRVVETKKGEIFDKVIRFETQAKGTNDNLDLSLTDKLEGDVKSYAFECDMMLSAGSSQSSFQIHLVKNKAQLIRITFGAKNGYVRFINRDYQTGNQTIVNVAKAGEWFKLRLEYYTVSENGGFSTRLKVFINGDLLYVTDMRNAAVNSGRLDEVNILALKDSNAVLYLDDLSFSESSQEYDGAPITEGYSAKGEEN